MWLGADIPPAGSDALTIAVWTFAGVVVTQIVVLIAPVIKARFERTATTSPPQSASDNSALILARDIGQLDQRADDSDQRDDLQDKAIAQNRADLDDVLDYLDEKDPGWRQ